MSLDSDVNDRTDYELHQWLDSKLGSAVKRPGQYEDLPKEVIFQALSWFDSDGIQLDEEEYREYDDLDENPDTGSSNYYRNVL